MIGRSSSGNIACSWQNGNIIILQFCHREAIFPDESTAPLFKDNLSQFIGSFSIFLFCPKLKN